VSPLLDPRYHWLMDAARRIYAQLDPDEKPVVLSMLSASDDGEMLMTQVLRDEKDVHRVLVTDQSDALRKGEDLMAHGVARLNVPTDL